MKGNICIGSAIAGTCIVLVAATICSGILFVVGIVLMMGGMAIFV